MKLKKELIVVILIIIGIIILELITNSISQNAVNYISEEIDTIMENLDKAKNLKLENNLDLEFQNSLNEKIKKLKDDWFYEQDKLSFFAEHDELEKVTKTVIILEENCKNEEFEIALENGREFIYWLYHFKDKDKLEFKNIF